jgi:ferredoxin--NADP+ reductase
MNMSTQPGTASNPLRVAIIGSGPSAFYAADHYQKQPGLVVQIDMFDRLPTPFGLVRGGVAPDHAKIKSVTKVYDKIAQHPNFRFFGHVEFGRDLTMADVQKYYHQVVFAVGAQTDRAMGIPGEDLAGSHAATEFVAWYNGHPDYRELQFDLTQERAVVVGVGNVAMDVARILASSYNELVKTDIADYALDALKQSKVREIFVLARRGPAQAAFTNPEIKELGEMEEADIVVKVDEADLDPLSREALQGHPDSTVENNVRILQEYAKRPKQGSKKTIYMRFLVSPVELAGEGRVQTIKVVKNVLQQGSDGALRPKATDRSETFDAGLVFRSIGYRGVALPGVPFDEKNGVIPNKQGRVYDPKSEQLVTGVYAAGWIKRGPSGVIGTNKPDAQESVNLALEDLKAGKTLSSSVSARETVDALLRERKVRFVTYQDWMRLDKLEVENGKKIGRPRVKFTRVEDMLKALGL